MSTSLIAAIEHVMAVYRVEKMKTDALMREVKALPVRELFQALQGRIREQSK